MANKERKIKELESQLSELRKEAIQAEKFDQKVEEQESQISVLQSKFVDLRSANNVLLAEIESLKKQIDEERLIAQNSQRAISEFEVEHQIKLTTQVDKVKAKHRVEIEGWNKKLNSLIESHKLEIEELKLLMKAN
ncbi:MAG: hypothetical protein R2827_08530 [Bdellovibrionales bacterium]